LENAPNRAINQSRFIYSSLEVVAADFAFLERDPSLYPQLLGEFEFSVGLLFWLSF